MTMPRKYTTHEEFIERMRALGIPCEDETPEPGPERKQEIFLFQSPKGSAGEAGEPEAETEEEER